MHGNTGSHNNRYKSTRALHCVPKDTKRVRNFFIPMLSVSVFFSTIVVLLYHHNLNQNRDTCHRDAQDPESEHKEEMVPVN